MSALAIAKLAWLGYTPGRSRSHRALLSCAQVDSEREALAKLPTASPGRRARATNIAYIIFTSGSTGRPKGTVLQHNGAVNFLLDHIWCVTRANNNLKSVPCCTLLETLRISQNTSSALLGH